MNQSEENSMSVQTLFDAWVKAAVERVTLRISYHSVRTKGELTEREVEPDFIGTSRDGRNSGCWGYCRLRGANRVFYPDSIKSWTYVGNPFTPNPQGRRHELIPLYMTSIFSGDMSYVLIICFFVNLLTAIILSAFFVKYRLYSQFVPI